MMNMWHETIVKLTKVEASNVLTMVTSAVDTSVVVKSAVVV